MVESFWPESTARACGEEVRQAFAGDPPFAHRPAGETTDVRIYGFDKLNIRAAEFGRAFDSQVASYTAYRSVLLCTMANLVTRADYGSGGMWHRDGFVPALKVIVYLGDVSERNGPFQIIKNSHVWGREFSRDHARYGWRFRTNRLGSKVDVLLAEQPERVFSFTGKAGSAIVFDTSAIHTGAPLLEGERVALTNYYVAQDEITPALYDLYSPLVTSAASYWKDGKVYPIG